MLIGCAETPDSVQRAKYQATIAGVYLYDTNIPFVYFCRVKYSLLSPNQHGILCQMC